VMQARLDTYWDSSNEQSAATQAAAQVNSDVVAEP
jgi:hypothetical protein